MFQYRNSPVQKRTGSPAASLMAAIPSGRKMADAESLENQNENRRTDELQETLLEPATDSRCGDAVVISTRLRHGTSALLRHVQKLCAHPGKWLPSTHGGNLSTRLPSRLEVEDNAGREPKVILRPACELGYQVVRLNQAPMKPVEDLCIDAASESE